MTLYAWPARTVFGRAIPKKRIYESAALPSAARAKFVEQVERIEWTHVLRADTLNLRPSKDVEEIAVISVALHTDHVDQLVLAAIDKAIPRPLIVELSYAGRERMAAAWKRPSLAEAGKWVISPHFFTPWQSAGRPGLPLPPALDMAALYQSLLDPILPERRAANETIDSRIARAEEAAQIAREISRLEAGLKREKQFNRKVELNAALRAARSRQAGVRDGVSRN